jgi:predicted transcriptional regulator
LADNAGYIIKKISSINDESFLNAINTIINAKSEKEIYETSKEQKAHIQEGIAQIENGKYFTNEQVESEISQWLREK